MKQKEKLYTEEQNKEIQSIWDKFKKDIIHNNRFFSGKDIVSILDKIRRIDEERNNDESLAVTLSPMNGCINLYRARIGNYINEEDNEMLNPPDKKTNAGRCNPKGISYLYLASNEDTAIQEVRPNLGDEVTVAEIKIAPVDILGFDAMIKANDILIGRQLKTWDVEALINIINNDLSKVVTVGDENEYAPYQFLAEYIKNRGFGCFRFSSSIAKGTNYVLFDSCDVEIVSKKLYKVNKLICNYEEI